MTNALPPPQEDARAPGPEIPFARSLAALFEDALNREIRASTAAADVLAELDGRSFAIEVLGTGIRCVLRADSGRVAVEPSLLDSSCEVSATLRATPLDLVRLVRAGDVAGLKGTNAQLAGSPEIAERFAALLRFARPDLEEHVAGWIGDVPAHALARAARDAAGWLHRAADALRMNTAEFLQEESRALPGALEAQAFYADVERLRDDVERAAARLTRLERARTR